MELGYRPEMPVPLISAWSQYGISQPKSLLGAKMKRGGGEVLMRARPDFRQVAHSDTVIPDMETAYRNLQPLFYHALSKLARQGFAVPMSDSVDLIHDFFAEAWSDVTKNYKRQKGAFSSYAYGAFVRFARPRIIRLQRLQGALVEPSELAQISNRAAAAVPTFESRHDEEKLKKLLAELPEFEREILVSYVCADKPSERTLARKYLVSRHRLRETLLSALGRVSVSLDLSGQVPSEDWKVAVAIWQERRTFREAALYLGKTEHQVRLAHSRNRERLAEVLRFLHFA